MTKPVILDSSALIAQINLGDSLHEKAEEITNLITKTDRQVILPHEVFAETINIFGKKVGRKEAVMLGRELLARHKSGMLIIATSDADILNATLDFLGTAKGKKPSFIDCLVMVYANVYKTKEIFDFDEAFEKNGYTLPTHTTEQQAA